MDVVVDTIFAIGAVALFMFMVGLFTGRSLVSEKPNRRGDRRTAGRGMISRE
jgi:hypothetical protein